MEFSINFDQRDLPELHRLWDEVIQSGKWTEGKFTQQFEELWSEHNGLKSVSFASWADAAEVLMDFYGLKGQTVLCPSNTFMATPLSVIRKGGQVQFVDCNREDLCMSFEDFKTKAEKYQPKAAWIVHIGGHIAFDTPKIAEYCKSKGILLLEDCAHAHGAVWNGKRPGQWGSAGVYSFYATKTLPTGEGGMLVTQDQALVDYARKYRNYGKFEYDVPGTNGRMSEFTAVIGVVQTRRLPEMVDFKNWYAREYLDPQYTNRVKMPAGMTSGYYKYIVFDRLEKSTGKVYDLPCHKILKHSVHLPNT